MRPVTLFTGQWADLSLEIVCKKAKEFGYDGVELACWGDHIEVIKAKFSETPTDAGVFGGHQEFGDRRRYWDFVSPGRGDVNFEEVIRVRGA